ncbi:MAG: type II toxin-antitoxin system VapC family toxin [Steroidobacteraceae bacterium]|nr:type II toxin-antitoxin system VapC family toxin [Steroidobacteraceae bacterium]
MVLDTSAIVAILQDEPERGQFIAAIEAADTRWLSVANFVEASIVIETRVGPDGIRDLDLLIAKASIELVPVDPEQAHLARHAWRRFGKGHHSARLNFGDCFAYALAATMDEPLLYKGGDFSSTDIPRHPCSRPA